MTTAKGKKAPAKPAPKAAAKHAAKDIKAVRAKAPPAKTPAAKAVKGPKAPAASKPAASARPDVTVSMPAPAADSGLIKKKKVKRGAPPMLPRRVPRRALPPLEGAAPPPPKPTITGSLHAPARSPEGAERLKANLTAAINALAKLKGLKRNLQRQFWDIGVILHQLSMPDLYQAKGYGSWDTFVEREIERELSVGRTVVTDLVRIVKIFQRESAEELGLDRIRVGLKAMFPETGTTTSSAS
jgi:hypothetical protein